MYLYILQEIDKIGRCAPFSSSATTTGGLLSPTSIVRKPQHLQTLKLQTLQPIVKLPTTIKHQIKTKKRTPNLPTNSTSINRSINQTTPTPTPNQQNDQPSKHCTSHLRLCLTCPAGGLCTNRKQRGNKSAFANQHPYRHRHRPWRLPRKSGWMQRLPHTKNNDPRRPGSQYVAGTIGPPQRIKAATPK